MSQCLICTDDLTPTTACAYLPCTHSQFCYPCLLSWSAVTSLCPLCKSPFYIVYKAIDGYLTSDYVLVDQKKAGEDVRSEDSEVTECEVCLQEGDEGGSPQSLQYNERYRDPSSPHY